MARPVALPALPASPIDLARAAGVAVVGLLLAVLVAWPVAALLVHGLQIPATQWPWRLAARTLGVALCAALGALAMAVPVALALTRLDVPGRGLLWRIFGLSLIHISEPTRH